MVSLIDPIVKSSNPPEVKLLTQTKMIQLWIVHIRTIKLCSNFTINLSKSPEFQLTRYFDILDEVLVQVN